MPWLSITATTNLIESSYQNDAASEEDGMTVRKEGCTSRGNFKKEAVGRAR